MSGIYDDRWAYSPEEWQRLDKIRQELREAMSEQPERCPTCGYTKHDAQYWGDHRLCKNAGNAPWEKKGHSTGSQPCFICGKATCSCPPFLQNVMPPLEPAVKPQGGNTKEVMSIDAGSQPTSLPFSPPDPDYDCGAAFCDDPACRRHGVGIEPPSQSSCCENGDFGDGHTCRKQPTQTGGNDARTANSDRVLSADSSICSQSVAMSAREFQQSTEWHDTLKANLPKSLTDHECLFAESYAAELRSQLAAVEKERDEARRDLARSAMTIKEWGARVTRLTEALRTIANDDRDCGCDHRTTEDCCINVGIVCPRCIAAEALSPVPQDSKEQK